MGSLITLHVAPLSYFSATAVGCEGSASSSSLFAVVHLIIYADIVAGLLCISWIPD